MSFVSRLCGSWADKFNKYFGEFGYGCWLDTQTKNPNPNTQRFKDLYSKPIPKYSKNPIPYPKPIPTYPWPELKMITSLV